MKHYSGLETSGHDVQIFYEMPKMAPAGQGTAMSYYEIYHEMWSDEWWFAYFNFEVYKLLTK